MFVRLAEIESLDSS